jgi:hypothetical protein
MADKVTFLHAPRVGGALTPEEIVENEIVFLRGLLGTYRNTSNSTAETFQKAADEQLRLIWESCADGIFTKGDYPTELTTLYRFAISRRVFLAAAAAAPSAPGVA